MLRIFGLKLNAYRRSVDRFQTEYMKAENLTLRVKAHFYALILGVISDARTLLEYHFEKIRFGVVPEFYS